MEMKEERKTREVKEQKQTGEEFPQKDDFWGYRKSSSLHATDGKGRFPLVLFFHCPKQFFTPSATDGGKGGYREEKRGFFRYPRSGKSPPHSALRGASRRIYPHGRASAKREDPQLALKIQLL